MAGAAGKGRAGVTSETRQRLKREIDSRRRQALGKTGNDHEAELRRKLRRAKVNHDHHAKKQAAKNGA